MAERRDESAALGREPLESFAYNKAMVMQRVGSTYAHTREHNS